MLIRKGTHKDSVPGYLPAPAWQPARQDSGVYTVFAVAADNALTPAVGPPCARLIADKVPAKASACASSSARTAFSWVWTVREPSCRLASVVATTLQRCTLLCRVSICRSRRRRALSSPDCTSACLACRQDGLCHMVAWCPRFHRAFAILHSIVKQGLLRARICTVGSPSGWMPYQYHVYVT